MSFEDSYGHLSNHLILQAKSSSELGKLLPYSGSLVLSVIQEQCELERKIQAMKRDGVTTSAHERWPTLIILARVVVQNKRCLLAYHSQRLETLTAAYWTAGGAVSHVISQLRDDMSRDEITYLREYHESVMEYRLQFSPDVIDLTMGIEDPPRESSFITVETIRDIGGPIYTESGLLDFQSGHQYVLLKRDVEHLILQGYLREV